MSLPLCTSDFVSLSELASQTLSIINADGGEAAELAQEVEGLYLALQRLELEISKSECLVTNPDSNHSFELRTIWKGCRKVLLKVGSEDVLDVERVRSKLCQHTSAVLLCLNLINAGSPGRIARRMNFQGKEMSKMRQSLNLVVAQLTSQGDGSVLTSGSEEDAVVWGELERKLVKRGYSLTVVRENQKILMNYVKELGDRGMLDDGVVARDVKDVPMGMSFEFAELPTPGTWLSNSIQFSGTNSVGSATSSAQSFSDLPLRNYDAEFDDDETPDLESDQSDCDSEASSDDESEGTSFVSEVQVEGKFRRTSEDDTELLRQTSDIGLQDTNSTEKHRPLPLSPHSLHRHKPIFLNPLSPNSIPISPLDIGFPRYTPAFYQPPVSPLLDKGYEPPSRSRLANPDLTTLEQQRLYQKFQVEDEAQEAAANTQPQEPLNQHVKFRNQVQGNPSATIHNHLTLRDLEATETALETRRRANSALARLLESEEAHNFRLQKLENMLQMTPINTKLAEISKEKATLEAVAKAAKVERREIRRQKLRWLLEGDGLQVLGGTKGKGKTLFERTVGVRDIFEVFVGVGGFYWFVVHESWFRPRGREGVESGWVA